MAIPDKPLVIKDFDPDDLTLGEINALYGDSYIIDEFTQFLIDHVDHAESWTIKEIRAIKRKELADVRKQLFIKIEELALPLPK